MGFSTHVLRELVDPLLIYTDTNRHDEDCERIISVDLKKRTSSEGCCMVHGDSSVVDESGIQDRQSFLAVVAMLIFFMRVASFRKPREIATMVKC
jgi:hypothetical protein